MNIHTVLDSPGTNRTEVAFDAPAAGWYMMGVMPHCTMPYDMAQSFGYDTHFESGIGVAVKGELRREPVTILRLDKDLKSYWIAEGEITDNLNESTLCRTQIEVKLDDSYSVVDLLRVPCGNHHIVFYGRHRDEIVSFLG